MKSIPPKYAAAILPTTLCIFATSILSVSAQSSEKLWILQRNLVLCVGDNINEYRKAQDQPFLIVLPACPNPDPVEGVLEIARGNLFQSRAQQDADEVPRSIIEVSEEELLCIIEVARAESGETIKVHENDVCK